MTSITRPASASVPALAAAPSSDESLIKRIAGGDKLAMQVLYARHHVRVFRFVVRIVHDESMCFSTCGVRLIGLKGAQQFRRG
jgi:hypothetical protein